MEARIENAYGDIEISTKVFADLAGYAATGAYGVVGMANRSKTDGIVRLLKKDAIDKGVKVTVDGGDVVIELHIMVEYGVNIRAISDSIINKVRYFVESSTGFNVRKVTVHVDAIHVD